GTVRQPQGRSEPQPSCVGDPAVLTDPDLDAGLERHAGPGLIRLDDSGGAHGASSQKCRMPRARRSRAAATSLLGTLSFGLCATSMVPGPKIAQSSPSRCSQPASVAKETVAVSLWPT